MADSFLVQKGGASFNLTTNEGYTLLGDYTVSGSAITSYTFSGLNITKDDEAVLVSYLVAGSSSDFYLYFNNNVTPANYYSQRLTAITTTVGSSRVNSAVFTYNGSPSEKSHFIISNIKLANNGYICTQSSTTGDVTGGSPSIYDLYTTSTLTSTNISQIDITGQFSNKIGIGSRFQLYIRQGVPSKTWSTT